MRRTALLLLLLVLPGLLVPVGAWWHVCRCIVPMDAEPVSCCAPTPTAAAAPSCCSNTTKPTAPTLPAAADDDCRCEWLSLPDLGDDTPAAADHAPAAVPPPRRLAAIAAPVAMAPPTARAWTARHQRPPPDPFAARNLPLRI